MKAIVTRAIDNTIREAKAKKLKELSSKGPRPAHTYRAARRNAWRKAK